MPLAAALAVAAVVGGVSQVVAGNKAAGAVKDTTTMQIAEARRREEQDRADIAPWREAGMGALDVLSREAGITPGGNTGATAFTASPGYEYRRDQGLKAIERMQNARGMWNSGATRTALIQRAGDEASSEYGNWWNRLSGMAGTGQSATNTAIASGQNTTGNIINAQGQAGQARASSYINTGSAVNSGINSVLSAYLYNRGATGG